MEGDQRGDDQREGYQRGGDQREGDQRGGHQNGDDQRENPGFLGPAASSVFSSGK